MKLKKAKKIAKKFGYKYIAVDYDSGDLSIFAYNEKRIVCETLNRFIKTEELSFNFIDYSYIGKYTGSKDWKYTLREVK